MHAGTLKQPLIVAVCGHHNEDPSGDSFGNQGANQLPGIRCQEAVTSHQSQEFLKGYASS
jgi:hypothetical protein